MGIPISLKPTDYPQALEARIDREWRAYDEYYSEQTLERPYFYHNLRREERFVDSLITRFGIERGQAILDLGCGNGLFSDLFQKRGLRVTAVDRSPKAIDYCRRNYGPACEWICDDAFSLPQSGQYDHVFCFYFMYFNAFDRLQDAEKDARRMMDYVKPGGKLFFVWHSDLTAIRLPPERFSVMNYTLAQLKQLFSGYSNQAYAIDSPARICSLLGRYSFNKYVTRLTHAWVSWEASSWKRARQIVVIERK